jgi:energy-coupling factor transporter ATP-binding protein EcfA2
VDTQPSAPAAEPQLAAGMRVRHYELIRELGRGGMGVVWAARDTKLGRRVAIKFVVQATQVLAEQFLVEAQATAQCTHEHIVIIHEVDEHDGMPYMVLEFLEGHTLREAMTAVERFPTSRVLELVLPVARALARAHELAIVHRDLKPENVFVTTAGQIKVLDFGIAKALGGELRAGLERPGALVGTLPYMAPEQMTGGEVDVRADVWAVGIMMWELLTGTHPIHPPVPDALFEAAASDAMMPSLAIVEPQLPAALSALVDRCLSKPREQRPTAAELVRALEQLAPTRAGRTLAADESPYPGLAAFQEADANRFFGRDRDIARVAARVRAQPLTGIVGPSGAGKSSFVRAGLAPMLKESGERWEVLTLRPGRNPLASLASLALRSTARGDSIALAERLVEEPGRLGALLRERAHTIGGHILLFVDQLEELYTLVPDAAVRRAFTAVLAGVADDPDAPLRVVVSMRSDFLDRVTEHASFADELAKGLVFLATPDRDGLRDALVQPVELAGFRFETPEMIDDMLGALANTAGALPLLQFAASKLWEARDRERRLVTTASYAAIGGISGALASHADEVVAGLTQAAQRLARRIFRALVTPERTRAIVELADLQQLAADGAEVTRVVDQLVAARLLVIQTRGDAGGTVEIVHESLIERWPSLRRWLDEDQEDAAYLAQVAAAAKQWAGRGKPSGLLWRGDAIDEARRWLTQRPRDLPERDRAFLDAGLALARRGRRARVAALIALFGALAAVAAGAIASRASIQRAKIDAEASAARATEAAHTAQTALDDAEAKERARLAAERTATQKAAEAKQASAEAAVATAEVAESREQLQAQNEKLAQAVHDAVAARQRAEAASKTAQDAKAALQQALDRERARVHQLEQEQRKLSTRLKE